MFSELRSHYLFEDRFGRPGKGNDRGKVEGLVGYCRRNFLVPMPRFQTFDGLNAHLEGCCRKRWAARLRGHGETIGERVERDRAILQPLPATPYDACDKRAGWVNSLSLVRYRGTDYSVPTRFGHYEVLVRGYVHEVVISHGADVIARHPRSYEHEDFIFDPLHYLSLLEQKSNALDQAAPLNGWKLPPVFGDLRRLLEARMGKKGKREYVQVLRLLETFPTEEVRAAVSDVLQRGVIGWRHGAAVDAFAAERNKVLAAWGELRERTRAEGGTVALSPAFRGTLDWHAALLKRASPFRTRPRTYERLLGARAGIGKQDLDEFEALYARAGKYRRFAEFRAAHAEAAKRENTQEQRPSPQQERRWEEMPVSDTTAAVETTESQTETSATEDAALAWQRAYRQLRQEWNVLIQRANRARKIPFHMMGYDDPIRRARDRRHAKSARQGTRVSGRCAENSRTRYSGAQIHRGLPRRRQTAHKGAQRSR